MTADGRLRATVADVDDGVFDFDATAIDEPRASWLRPLRPSATDASEGRTRYEAIVAGWRFEVAVEPTHLAVLRERARRGAGESRLHVRQDVRAQIPGRVVAVHVAPGDTVASGDRLLSIEAMKMENEVRATRPATIASVAVTAGQRVELGDVLVVLE